MRIMNNIGRVLVKRLKKVLSWKYLSICVTIITIVVGLVFAIFTSNKRTIIENDVLLSELTAKIDLAKEEINNRRMFDYVDTITNIGYKKLFFIEDKILLYIENLEDLLEYNRKLKDFSNDSINYYIQYYNKAIGVFKTKPNLIKDILFISNDTLLCDKQLTLSLDKSSMFIYKMENMISIIENDFIIIDSINEKSNDSIQDNRIWTVMTVYDTFHSKEFYEVELCFLELVIDYYLKIRNESENDGQLWFYSGT